MPDGPTDGEVGLIGLGRMGQAIGHRLLARGHRLVVHNRTRAKAEDLLVAGQRYWTVDGSLPTVRDSQSHLNTAKGRGE